MSKSVSICILFFSLFFFAEMARAADVVITTIGQTPEGMMVKMLMKKLDIDPDYEALLTPEALHGKKVLIAVVGGSVKGLSAAGTDMEKEKIRCIKLLQEAKKRGVMVLVMHIGGAQRRGNMTDMFIDAVTKFGDKLIVVKSGNADDAFTKAKAANAPLVEVEGIQAIVPPLGDTLRAWTKAR